MIALNFLLDIFPVNSESYKKLARFFNHNEKEMMITYLSEKIACEIGKEEYAKGALKVAEEIIDYETFISIDRKKIIHQTADILKQFSKVEKAWIYGSFSRKDDEPGSDIDIAVKTDDGLSYFDLAEIQYRLENALRRKVDLGFMDSFRPGILENVKKDLKLIYERSKD